MILALSPDYGYVLLAAVSISLQCLLFGFIFPNLARRKYLNQSFIQIVSQSHIREANPEYLSIKADHSDPGSVQESSQISYGDWVGLNNAKRVHYNFLESLSSVITLLLIGGIYYPVAGAYLGVGIMIGRVMYSFGYSFSGSSLRLIGAVFIDIGTSGLFVLSIVTGARYISGILPPQT